MERPRVLLSISVDRSLLNGQIADGRADEFKLFFRGLKELEAVLKTLAISDFSTDQQRLGRLGHLKLDLDQFAQADVSGYGRAHAAFTKVLGASM